jgi:N-acetylglucosamine malate deacetylase 1
MSTERTALVLVAHADDETLGCGGTLQVMARDGWDIHVVVVADGIISTRESVMDNAQHTNAACRVLGVPDATFLGFPDQHFDTRAVAEIAGAVGALKLEPDLILTHVATDLNRDHVIVNEVARIVGRPRAKPVAILGCEIPNTSFWAGNAFPANYFVGLEERDVAGKIRAFCCYENELRPYPHPWSEQGLRLLAQYHGMQCGHPFAEAFQVIRGYHGLMP